MRRDYISNFGIFQKFIELQHDLLWRKIPLQDCELPIDPTVIG